MTKPTCYHQKKTVVWSDVGNDGGPLVTRQLRHQCNDCGRLLPNALPHSLATQSTPKIDYAALNGWLSHDREQLTRWRLERQQLEQQRQTEWRVKYEDYLQSEQWMYKREKVFERCKGLCEGCRENRATAVHHLTYDHLGKELLWELAAVCTECHEKAHNIT